MAVERDPEYEAAFGKALLLDFVGGAGAVVGSVAVVEFLHTPSIVSAITAVGALTASVTALKSEERNIDGA